MARPPRFANHPSRSLVEDVERLCHVPADARNEPGYTFRDRVRRPRERADTYDSALYGDRRLTFDDSTNDE